jgi:Fe-S-cluster-containing hydrogenase component 2
LPSALFWRLSASDACSACRVCANLCPTGAIRMTLGFDENYTLSFLSAACTSCGECVDMCDEEALRQDGVPSAGALLALQPAVLRSGSLYRCERCNTRFAAAAQTRLCPLCTLRAAHPYGVRLAPGGQRRLPRPTQR